MKILVTGSEGFLGKNLVAQLNNEGFTEIYEYNRENTLEDLEKFTKDCHFVFHLAGVNRPKTTSEFFEGNTTLTEVLIKSLEKNGNIVPIVLSSSTQATSHNDYGSSKKKAEELVFDYASKNNIEVMIYRLTNLFGKWSKPNYNSVVATFCYNISRNIPLQINDKAAKLNLCYVDDVLDEFIKALKSFPTKKGDFCIVPVNYEITLSELANKIEKFHDNRETLIMPSLKNQLDRDLYATYLSYLSEDNFSYKLKKNVDDRGWLAEFIKSENNGQIFISTTKPGITRGNHWHHTKVEKFLVIKGKGKIRFRNICNNQVVDYDVDGEIPEVVDIPAGYTHNITNIGSEDMITLFWACEIFNPEKPDTYYMEV